MSNIHIPKHGKSKEEIFGSLEEQEKKDVNYKGYKVFSLVYYLDKDHEELVNKAAEMFSATNYLNPMAFKSLKKMERDLVRFGLEMLNGNTNSTGVVTTGGTESILMACKTYRDMAIKKKISKPEMIVPETIHPAFLKAAEYFQLKMVTIPIDDNKRVQLGALEKAINRNTAMIAVSAPQYPHGVMDPVERVAEIALKHKIPFHVDSCIGGFVLPWIEKLGEKVPLFDFRVPGVTSISADIHKYGYSNKGTSLLLYENLETFKHQIFVAADFPGGVYASSSLLGSRAGGPIAGAWASLNYLGEEGFLKLTKNILNARDTLMKAIDEIPELRVVAPPESTLVAYESVDKKIDIYTIADQLEAKGWFVDRQMKPNSIHCSMMPGHVHVIEEYINDIKQAIQTIRDNPGLKNSGKAATYGLMGKLPFRGMVKSNVVDMYLKAYNLNEELVDMDEKVEGIKGKVINVINKIL
jgi:glutamate/tyrosine decarboxylase-like PLP-dependent enzyme